MIIIYLRHKQDFPIIRLQINEAFPDTATVYVAAEVCRADLLLELDGIWKLQC